MTAASPSPLRALLVEGVHPTAADLLTASGIAVEQVARALDTEELVARLQGVQVLGLRSGTRVTAEVLAAAPDLRVVGAFCIGTNQIDLQAATERGVAVFNAPFSNTRSVVELAVADIIALTRRLTVHNDAMHAGLWRKSAEGSHELRGRRLGIVGYGRIGSQLSVLAEALGMRVSFYDTADKLAFGNARRCSTLDELLGSSDVVTLHVDGRPGNSGMFGEEQFARMLPGALFLNLSRGFVVDHRALRRHVDSGHLAGAAVDVFPHEPAAAGEPFESELRGLPNVILTPHVGGSTEEAQRDIGEFVAAKLLGYLERGATGMSVNLPEVQPTGCRGTTRLTLLHRNQPGALAGIDSVLADGDLHVDRQVLATTGSVGYAVTDVRGGLPSAVVDRLRRMPATIRVDVLAA
jgi:D-3-phosphoglycerate dehydrogenase / 2-oxoglutarate reductase